MASEGDVGAAVGARVGWATEMLRELVRIPSVTGEESAAQDFVTEILRGLGADISVLFPTYEELSAHPSFSDDGLPLGERPVVVGRWGDDPDRPTIVLNGHVDVVPPGDPDLWPHPPYSGALIDGEVHGRGACDMKGGLVAGMLAVSALREAGIDPGVNVIFHSVIGEETGGAGTLAAVVHGHTGDAAIILEPTGADICPVGAGAASFRLHVHGRAAHGAMRREGVSAIDKFVALQAAMARLEEERHADFHHPAFAEGELVAPVSVGTIVAGDWPSTVPDRLVAEGRFGILPGESLDDGRRALESALAGAAETDPWLRDNPPRVEWFEGQFAPAETELESQLVRALGDAHALVHARPPSIHGVTYGSDMRFFANDAGMPAVLYGPGDIALAHTVEERVAIREVRDVANTVALMLMRWNYPS